MHTIAFLFCTTMFVFAVLAQSANQVHRVAVKREREADERRRAEMRKEVVRI